jgi:hypothetical protein
LDRDRNDFGEGRFDEQVMRFIVRSDAVYKTLKESEMWKDFEKSQVGTEAPASAPPIG